LVAQAEYTMFALISELPIPTATVSPSATPEKAVIGQTVHVPGESLALKVTLENRTEMCLVIGVPAPMVTDPTVAKSRYR